MIKGPEDNRGQNKIILKQSMQLKEKYNSKIKNHKSTNKQENKMKQFKTLFLINAMILLLISSISISQEVPGDWGKDSREKDPVNQPEKLSQQLLQRLNDPEVNKNPEQRMQLHTEIDRVLGAEQPEDKFGITKTSVITTNFNNPPFQQDWYTTDVQIFSGSLSPATSYRNVELNQAEDGNLYTVVKRPGSPGAFNIYRSTNGGATWPYLITYNTGSGYIGSISMLLESRSNSNPDSTRILVYFTFSGSSNLDNASLYVLNVLRSGSGGVILPVGNPSAGNKLEYVSACSDGMYYAAPTYMHAVVREATNAGVQVGLRHYRTTNWGLTHSVSQINTTYDDFYPSAAFSRENGTNDSIYIAVERRLSATEYELRIIATHEIPTTNFRVFYITSAVSGVKYEKPAITIVQQNINIPRKILVTSTRNRNPRYHYSANSGTTWVIDQLMGTSSTVTADFTNCNSDSLTSGGQYAIMGFVTDDGDSVNVKQLTIPPSTTYAYYKRNSNQSSGVIAPSTAIYKVGTTKYSAFAYSGFGPSNIYFNAEQLITGIEPIGNNLPDKFELSQNYPNPFNPVTNINFSIPRSGSVKLVVFDVQGRVVTELVNGNYNAGSYKVDFDAAALSSGVYFYKIETEGFTDVKKMMLVK